MFEASYGMPPEKAEDVIWVTAAEFVAREGADREQWKIKPHCPHCKTVLKLYDAKGSQGFYLVSQEITEKPENIRDLDRPVIGFAHTPKTAKADCPYSFKDDPRYAYPPGHNTAKREKEKNLEFFSDPHRTRPLKKTLNRFMQILTGEKKVSSEHKDIIKRLTRSRVIHTQGLAEHEWLLPYMQVIMFGAYQRGTSPNISGETPVRRRAPKLKAWRPGPPRKLTYTSVNDEERVIEVPETMILCFVYPQNLGVKYVPVKEDGKRNIVFKVEKKWVYGVDKPRRREAKRSVLEFRDKVASGGAQLPFV